ncbi:very short patch repair endonuclease [Acinetobacter sp. WZC-1]|uniref:very short patch repair endonuclease n=1 Tax=Acinetobacter sp. WZC-1 TaxID=3459034 RepID=UPI00403E31EB
MSAPQVKRNVDPARSRNMSAIRDKNTRPEMMIRKALHRQGFRYRLYHRELPGKPDLILKKYHTVIFVNGCFWHKHSCAYFKWPKTNQQFWQNKIMSNVARDEKNIHLLLEQGWKVCIWWECATRNADDFQWSLVRFREWIHNAKSQYIEL